MSYYTNYTLEHDGGVGVDIAIEANEMKYAVGDSREACKWYDYEKDMIAFSKMFPKVTFILTGEGEESGDLWKAKFKNGRVSTVKAILTYPDFDF
jgi:hypothetical protein